ncbi:uncharacterized protein LOC132557732 [Ylistrum balloti]|uniref:uncharacterized protein LOC132557732 n=1 Tax=Ylistrum balloti TaxID=509963 RepID=UPI002905AC84|nr:uncharacterized protein LOC132557732 [Ylistrum balloti]
MDYSVILYVVVSGVVSVSRGMPADATQMCSEVLGLDCSTDYIVHGEETLCGTDGVTYLNKCFHVQARCNDVTINKAYDGKCQNDVTTNVETAKTTLETTNLAEVSTMTSEYNFQLNEQFCNTSLDDPCPTILDPLCGTDFKFYQNVCEFQKSKCVDRTLELQSLSNCKDGKHSLQNLWCLHVAFESILKFPYISNPRYRQLLDKYIAQTSRNLCRQSVDKDNMEDLVGLLFLIFTALIQRGETGLPVVSIDQLCEQVEHMDCDTEYVSHGDEQTCGMDGITYENFCHYAKARCSNVNIGITNVGSCIVDDIRSTPPPDRTTTPHPDVIIQFFCKNADNIDCLLEGHDPYCGNDGLTYQNLCAFAKAKCVDPNLESQSLQYCKDASTIQEIGK